MDDTYRKILEQKNALMSSIDNPSSFYNEYMIVTKIISEELIWEISYKNRIQLINKNLHNNIAVNYKMLKDIVNILDISNIKIKKSFEETQNITKFISFFKKAEELYDKLNILQSFNFEISNTIFTYNSLQTNQIEMIINNLEKIIQISNDQFSKMSEYKICIFTKEHFFKIYQLYNNYVKNDAKSPDLLSIFEGNIITSFFIFTHKPVDDCYNLFKEKIQPFDFNADISNDDLINYEKSLINFSKIFSNVISQLMINRKRVDEYSYELTTKYDFSLYMINTEPIIYISSKEQLHLLILYLLNHFKRDALPIQNQLLICSKHTKKSQIDSLIALFMLFAKQIDTRNGKIFNYYLEKYTFIIVSPNKLPKSLHNYLLAKLEYINTNIQSESKIIILFNESELVENSGFTFNTIIEPSIINAQYLSNLYNAKKSYGIQAYYAFDQFARTGKTQSILKHIYENYPNHIYKRIIVDESTSLTQLINNLNEIGRIDNKDKQIIFHFNINTNCDSNFHLHIQNLAYFRSLNDGFSIPFIANYKMVFYFEFSSCDSLDKIAFIHKIFPIAEYMEEIKIESNLNEFFSYDEYQIISHNEITNTSMIVKQEKNRKHLIDAAVIVHLAQDQSSILKLNKSSLHIRYSDFISNYEHLYEDIEKDPKLGYNNIINIFDKAKIPTFSQINDVCIIISEFKNQLLNKTTYEIESTVDINIRLLIANLAIETAIKNCSLPYIQSFTNSEDNKDILILRKIKESMTNGTLLCICNAFENDEKQSLTLLCDDSDKEKYEFYKNAMNIYDLNLKHDQDLSNNLFTILSNIFLDKNEKNVVAMIINTWRSFNDESKFILQEEWSKNIDNFKKNVQLKDHSIDNNTVNSTSNNDKEFYKRKKFWDDIQERIVKHSIFDISLEENKEKETNHIFVSNDIFTFISNCEKYLQKEESLIHKYILTPQNLMLLMNIVSRIYSKIPIILIGETGSGKEFTIKFLSEILYQNIEVIKYDCNNCTKESDIHDFVKASIEKIKCHKLDQIKNKFKLQINDQLSKCIIDSINFLLEEENAKILTDFDEVKKKINKFINSLDAKSLSKYDVVNENEKEGLINYIIFNINQMYLEFEEKRYLLFFNELNTTKCQCFIKDIIIDRYFEGEPLPDYIQFICTANPLRKQQYKLSKSLDFLEDEEQENKTYKVEKLLKSFIPYLIPIDQNREYGYNKNKTIMNDIEYLYDVDINSEFDLFIEKAVENKISEYNQKYPTSFDYSFFYNLLKDHKESLSFNQSFSHFISRITIFCCRLLYRKIYEDKSFISIRDVERCIDIMRWLYNFGLYENIQLDLDLNKSIERLLRSFIIGLTVTFIVRLSDVERKMVIVSICRYWTKLENQCDYSPRFKALFKAPTIEEWSQIIDNEMNNYSNLFVTEQDHVSKNKALNENIWIIYISIMNNIPLWIIGKPGTSKTLAVNIVVNKLMNKDSSNDKILKCPPLIVQRFLCTKTTTEEDIMEQLEIVSKISYHKKDDNFVLPILILDQMEQLKTPHLSCIHNAIDNGCLINPSNSIPIQIIGISIHEIDSIKLNRGTLLLRCSFSREDIKKTAFNIFKSTNLALNPDSLDATILCQEKIEKIGIKYLNIYNNSNIKTEKPFIGFRDFYGLIKSLTDSIVKDSDDICKVLTIIRRNLTGIPYSEKTFDLIKSILEIIFPDQNFDDNNYFKKLLCSIDNENNDKSKIIRNDIEKVTAYYDTTKLIQANINQDITFKHILISTVNAAAFSILFQSKDLILSNSSYEFFFSKNMSNLPDSEWLSNELKRIKKTMYKGDKTAIFIGYHPCLDSLYDIFNNQNFYPTASYKSNLCDTIINNNFKAIIIVESDIYKNLPPSFLDRFEKYHLTYETELLNHDIKKAKNATKSLKKKLQKDLSLAFGCYSDEQILSIYHILNKHEISQHIQKELFDLSIHPSELIFSTKHNKSFSYNEIKEALENNSNIRSSIAHLLQGYNAIEDDIDNISKFFYKSWRLINGIKSIIMVPSINNIDEIPGYDFVNINSTYSLDLESRIQSKIKVIDAKTKEVKNPKPIVVSILINKNDTFIEEVLQYEYILENIREFCLKELNINNRPIHTLIVISMENKMTNLKINQSIEWPLIYMDTCYDNKIKTIRNNGLPLSLKQIVFTPIKNLVNDYIIDLNDLIKTARKSIQRFYPNELNEIIDNLLFKDEHYYQLYIFNSIKSIITKEKEENINIQIKDCVHNLWSFNKICYLSSPQSSLIEYLSIQLIDIIGDILGIIIEILLSGIFPYDDFDKSIFNNCDIFNFLMSKGEIMNNFHYILNNNSINAHTIDFRYNYDVNMPGQFYYYKYIWKIALKIVDNRNVKDEKDLYKKVTHAIFDNSDSNQSLLSDLNNLMNSRLSSDESLLSFPFIAAYLLVIADSVDVNINYLKKFATWVACFIEILKGLYGKNQSISNKFIFFHLSTNKDLKEFARNFTIPFMFFPFLNQQEIDSNNLVLRDIRGSIINLPDSKQIYREEAYLLFNFVFKNLIQTINNLDINIRMVNNLFRNEFNSIANIYSFLIYELIPSEDYDYLKEQKYYYFFCIIQEFFIICGDNLIEENDLLGNIFRIKPPKGININELFKVDNVEKFIPFFVEYYINEMNLTNQVDIESTTNFLLIEYLEKTNNVYVGMIDAEIDYFDGIFNDEDDIEEEEVEEEQNEIRNTNRVMLFEEKNDKFY